MLQDQRVIFSDDGTLSDFSVNLGNFRSGSETMAYTATEDYLYVGSFLPFNHKHLDVGTVNDQASVVSVSIWDGNNWQAAVDVIDQTDVSGVSLAQDGIISWSTNIDEGWQREQESKDVTGLTGTAIYNMYWVRFAWSVTLNASTALKFIGQKFSNDSDLYDIYPDLDNTTLKASFESGTDWEEQHYIAAQHIARDLKKDHTILTADQIMDFDLFKETSIHAVAGLIYWGMGQEEKHAMAKSAYKENLKQGFLNIDYNQDGRVNPAERTIIQGYLYR